MKNLKQKSPKDYQEVLEMERELRRRKQSKKAKYFTPNGKVADFIEMVGAGETFVSMLVGANAVGKTAAGANIVTNICYGVQNEWFDLPIFRKFPHLKKGRIISDPTTLKEKIIPELRKWFPENEAKRLPDAFYEETKDGKHYTSKFHTNTGFEIDLMSTEQALKEFESVDLGWVWIDEPMPKDRFNATIARGRLGMVVFWTYTPLKHSGWIKDWMDDMRSGHGTQYVDYVEAEMEDNCKEHGVRGILEHNNILKMMAAFPEDERDARVFGKFGHLLGRVHKRFSRNIHVIKPFPLDPKVWTTYHALDPHPRVPDHAMWVSVNKKGTKIVSAELVQAGLTKELVQRIKQLEESRNFHVDSRLIDPWSFNPDQHTENPTLATKLLELGLNYIGGSKDLVAGIKRTDDALDYELKEGELVRAPELYVFDTCPVTIKQMEEYVWDEYTGKGADEKAPKAKPRDKNDHMPENLHRLLLFEPEWRPFTSKHTATAIAPDLDPYER